MNRLFERISVNPAVCHGRPCIKGTRVLDNIAADESVESIRTGYPLITREDVQAAVAYAAEMVRFRVLDVPLDRAG